ncbi:hypothetical protein [Halogranum rubrum]|uniref:Uncharacterized protein n=1 Tax=Halogranum salarium B-1 TaxID=1210908 RepID=J2ZAS4_9EURY|nr:hypothetical protein [Halogranum salarium]EJN57750.1 hypothetical protein HSB1_38980 [Halogranum salarium B-1]
MKLVVDLPDTLVGRIRDAVEEGGYDDAREFVTTAIENQLELEEEEDYTGSFKTIDEAIQEFEHNKTRSKATSRPGDEPVSGPQIDLARRAYKNVIPVNLPASNRVSEGPLWGQYNRILPVKFVIRRLANVLDDSANQEANQPVQRDLSEFSTEVAWEAREFGKELERIDDRRSRARGEKLSAGFPTGKKTEKSIDRFESHFVGYADRNGNLTGAPASLRLVNITADKGSELGLSKYGVEFAALENPLFDKDVEADDPLSDQEKQFYISHVREVLPKEFNAMVHTAKAISEGDDRPQSLSDRVAELDDEWSDAQASTNRSGLISRMYELSLVDRHRVGQRGIGYELTEEGYDLIQSHERS